MTDESQKTRVIEFTQAGAKLRVTIGEKDRVTYGQIAPGTTRGGGGYALRIYEGASKDLTRAVFSGVESFREVGIVVQRQAVRRFGSEEWKFDDSSYTGKRAETVERRWVDIDEPLPEADAV